MPRRTEPVWVERIREKYASAITESERSAKAIENALSRLGPGYPKERTIRDILRKFEALPRHERQLYEDFRWPESMESGALPWEASRTLLEALPRFLAVDRRPTIRSARWLWHVSLAAPEMSLADRIDLAGELAAVEISGRSEEKARELEGVLAYQSDESVDYLVAVGRGFIPPRQRGFPVPPDATFADINDAVFELNPTKPSPEAFADVLQFLMESDGEVGPRQADASTD